MRKLSAFLIFLMVVCSFSQNLNDQIEFSEVIKVEDATKKELFNRALLWFTETFKSANDVLQIKDKENGELVGKGNSSFYVRNVWYNGIDGHIKFMIKIYVKDNRFKYIISDFYHKSRSGCCSVGSITKSNEAPRIFGFTIRQEKIVL